MSYNRKNLADGVVDIILAMITVDKRFLPGDKLPNENKLSEELRVSRTTLREAVRSLVLGGILEIRRGKGTYVKDNIPLGGLKLVNPLVLAEISAKDLMEIRLFLEPEVAYHAALRASAAEIKQIVMLGRQVEECAGSGKDFTESERLFHRAIIQAAKNKFMEQLMPIIYNGIAATVSRADKHTIEQAMCDHQSIISFLEIRNAEGTRTAMKLHILRAIANMELGKYD